MPRSAIVLAGLLMAPSLSGAEDALLQMEGALRLTVSASEAPWILGSAKTFEATLTNVSQAEWLIDVFGDLHEVYRGKREETYITGCWALVWDLSTQAPPSAHRGRMPLEAAQFVLLAPGHAFTKTLSLTLSGVAPGTYPLRLAYIPRSASASFSVPDGWFDQQKLRGRHWIGMAISEPFSITITPAHSAPN